MHWPGDSYPANTISADFLKLYYEHFYTVEINKFILSLAHREGHGKLATKYLKIFVLLLRRVVTLLTIKN